VEARNAARLPVPSCHLVFTLPHPLNPLILTHKRPLLTLLVNAARQTLVQCGQRNLGGQSGWTLVLHTWEQTLGAPCHGHGLMAAGALAAHGVRWIEADPRFLCPVRALRAVLRGTCCEALARFWSTDAWPCPEEPPSGGRPADCAPLRAQLDATEWVGYAKPPCAGSEHVLDDVGRSTPRIAIAHHRLLDVRDGRVRFASRHRREGHRAQAMTLDADALIRRFLLHGLPRGFMRLRHSGFLANRHQARTLRRCRALLGPPATPSPRHPPRVVPWRHEVTGIDLTPWPHWGASPSYGSRCPALFDPLPIAALLWRCPSTTRHEPAGFSQAAAGETTTGVSAPAGGDVRVDGG